MLFHEIYSSYYSAVSRIVESALAGDLDRRKMDKIIRDCSFAESNVNISGALGDGRWPIILDDYTTVLENKPSRPLTTLELRWLKSILSDPKVKLFTPDVMGLEDVEPLYGQDAFLYYDRYTDSDPFEDEAYVANFRAVMKALRERRRLRAVFTDGAGEERCFECIPLKMEYSPKDDKFRIIARMADRCVTVNMSRVCSIELLSNFSEEEGTEPPRDKKEIVILLEDKFNALERAMIHFSFLEKETSKLSDNEYRLTIKYFEEDEAELLIQVLSFGPMLRVISGEGFIRKMKERLNRQKDLL